MDKRINLLERMGLNSARLDHLLGHAEVRLARPEDAAAIAAIYNETALNGRTSPTENLQTEEGMQNLIEISACEANAPIYVFTADGQVAGYVRLTPFSFEPQACGETAEMNVYIGVRWRDQGLGIYMAGFAALLAHYIGYLNAVCWILDANAASRRLARATGCVEWGCFPKLARSAGNLVDVSVLGTRLSDFFSTSWGRRIRRRHDIAWDAYESQTIST